MPSRRATSANWTICSMSFIGSVGLLKIDLRMTFGSFSTRWSGKAIIVAENAPPITIIIEGPSIYDPNDPPRTRAAPMSRTPRMRPMTGEMSTVDSSPA